MKEFLQVLRRFVPPYKKYIALTATFNILSAVLNIFSFAALIPILQILFRTEGAGSATHLMPWSFDNIKEVLSNNADYYVTQLIANVGPTTTLLIIGLFLAFTTFLKTGAYFLSSATIIPVRTGVVRDIRNQLYRKITSLPLSFFSDERKGDIIARMTGDVQEIESSIMSSLDMLFKNPILITFYFGALIFISWQLTLFTIVFVPIFGWFMGFVGRKLKKKSIKAQSLWSDTMSQVEETLGGLRIVKAFCAEDKMNTRFSNINNEYRDAVQRVNIRQQMAHPMSEFLGTVLIMIVLWFGGALILGGKSTIDAPIFIYYMVILYSIINPIKDFAKAGYAIPKGMASMERINKILDAENDIVEPKEPKALDGFNEKLSFEHVNFRYPDGHRMILDDVSLDIPKGKTIAIVGASGAGKSTLVDLIPRFYDPTGGSITIDGTDIRDIRIADLRSLIGNVNQESILFNDTIFNNIAFGVENATMESVIEAAKIANAHDFIMEKEGGYDFNIGDRGIKLSGGQRQRISIARAILKNPPILILDEATASLDTESEKIVQEALDRLMSTRTTIAIAHRLSTIRNADEIIVMDEGRIVERGRHEDLLALNGYYRKLNDMQAL